MSLLGGLRNMLIKMLKIQPAIESRTITIREPLSFTANALKNRIWYRGDASELEQFYKQTAIDPVSKGRFWAAVPTDGLAIRKIHSGLPSLLSDRLSDIVISDLDGIELKNQAETDFWNEISKDNKADKLLGEAITETLAAGDGAFKITVDTDVTQYPLIEFYSGERVDYKYNRGRLQEVIFYTDYSVKEKDYRLAETYGKGYIRYKLYDSVGKEVALTTVAETAALQDITYEDTFIMAVPLMFFKSSKWAGRGKSIFDGKSDNFDALDEVISQWIDAIRSGRVQKYIPEDLIPKNPNTGELLKPNPFDNQFIKIGSSLAEDSKSQIATVQPQIMYEAFVASYASILDVCLQGIISPSTLGIDLKKTDNAEAQREKEKATLYTRGKIVDALNEVIPQLVDVVLKVYDTMMNRTAGEYEVSVTFGEYASPSFDTVVETVGKAKTYGIMSTEQCIESLYGDTWTDEQKAEEVMRLKTEQGLMATDEPSVTGQDGDVIDDDTEGVEGAKSLNLNGAQMSSLLAVVRSVKSGEISSTAAIALVTSSFGMTDVQARSILEDNNAI